MTVLRLALLSAFAIFTASQCFAACIDDQKSGSDATINQDAVGEIADVRQEVDTGGLTCGKCARLWHTDILFENGFDVICRVDDATNIYCCPTKGDTGCPEERVGYEWRACADVQAAFGTPYCMDDDAYVQGGVTSNRGALCAEESIGCTNGLPRSN